jgi:hypothetical protein
MFIDVKNENQKIVMNGIMTPNYGLWLNLSESINPSYPPATGYQPIINGQVSYYCQDSLVSTISENNSGNYYDTTYVPQVGKQHKIVVEVPGLPAANTFVTIPEPVAIDEFNTEIVIRREGNIYNGYYNDIDLYARFTIEDPASHANYYMLGVYFFKDGRYQALQAETEDIRMNIYIKDGLDILAWDDKEIDGQTGDFTVFIRLYEQDGFTTRFQFTLYSIEESYFKYLKTYSQNFTIMNEDAFLFEAVPVFTNVEGGYGIVAAASSDSRFLDYTF